jgi:hypothetical protein
MSTVCECGKSELGLFDPRPVQTSMEKGAYVDIHPLSSPSGGGPIEFFIPSTSDEYIDLNDTMLYVRGKVKKEDRSNLTENALIALSNIPLASFFSDVSVIINDRQVEGGNHLYPYKTYMSYLLRFNKEAMETHVRGTGFYKDEYGKMEETEQKGFKARKLLIAQSKTFEFCGPITLDIFQQNRYLLPNADVRLKFLRHRPEFALISHVRTAQGSDPQINAIKGIIDIEDSILFVRRVKVSPSVLRGHLTGLDKYNAIYPIQRTEMQTFTITSGSQSFNKENIFRGQLPKLLVMGMVDNDAFNGTLSKNPFNFKHYDLNFLALYRDGEATPYRPFQPDYEKSLCMLDYMSLFRSLELWNRDETIPITFEEFKGGYTMYTFNLAPDLALAGHEQPYRDGNLRLEFKFAKALPATINVVLMALFDGRVEVTKSRDILLDYKT